jgi:hypothetical protein
MNGDSIAVGTRVLLTELGRADSKRLFELVDVRVADSFGNLAGQDRHVVVQPLGD